MIWPSTNQIGRLQLEVTNYCNAKCPQCERAHLVDLKKIENPWPEIADFDLDLNTTYIPLELFEKRFKKGEWDHLEYVHFCGNVDEPVIHPDIIPIIKHFQKVVPTRNQLVDVSVNGGVRDEAFWTELGQLSARSNQLRVIWGIDGLEDTNHMYRVGVRWAVLERNFRAYIKAGGHAIWQFIVFDWNKHQIKLAKKLCEKEGFSKFVIMQSVRGDDPEEITDDIIPDDYDRARN